MMKIALVTTFLAISLHLHSQVLGKNSFGVSEGRYHYDVSRWTF